MHAEWLINSGDAGAHDAFFVSNARLPKLVAEPVTIRTAFIVESAAIASSIIKRSDCEDPLKIGPAIRSESRAPAVARIRPDVSVRTARRSASAAANAPLWRPDVGTSATR